MVTGQTYSQNQFGEAQINSTLPIGGATGPLIKLAGGPFIFAGTGVPAISAPINSLFMRTDASSSDTYFYRNTDGGTTWAALILAS